ncbi:CFC_HP_G0101660.mRNA.1.CDS.1 [Saccharomyces cerevisiae]|nr:CFC_HP_G0101660.mRNA.1.CDS.1 [Saccharomyces cerevisiae]CAI6900743.1 CFC_HP_G0101660.mRNA.1.CDS.1 [Saccharomyces cerevisiae]
MADEKESLVVKFLMFFVGPIQFVMEAAAILAAGLSDWVDFGVICGLLMLNAGVGFVQEFQAGSIVDELKRLWLTLLLLSDGQLVEIPANEVVPGDIFCNWKMVLLSPTDGRIVTEDCFLQIDHLLLLENLGSCTVLREVKVYMVVTATGDNTFVEKLLLWLPEAWWSRSFPLSFERYWYLSFGFGHCHFVVGLDCLFLHRTNRIVSILRYTLGITIIGVPVGLPAVVTTTMAVGAAYLAKKQAIVQKLSAIESLAGVEILCSDKGKCCRLSLHDPYTLKVFLLFEAISKAKDAFDQSTGFGIPIPLTYLQERFSPLSISEGERIVCVKGAPLFVLKTVEEDHPIPEDFHENSMKTRLLNWLLEGSVL